MKYIVVAIAFFALGIAAIAGFVQLQNINTLGATPPGVAATVASTSNPSLTGGSAVGLFATSSLCTSRIITTGASAIMLTFTDKTGQTPTGSFGHLQAASTTVVYDSNQFGCGYVKAISYATQLVTITDVR